MNRLTAPRPTRGRPRHPAPDQGGYTLFVTLVAVLVCSIMVTAMLMIAMNTSRIETGSAEIQREIRAAEGALNIAIDTLRRNPVLGAQSDADTDCSAIQPNMVVDGVEVLVGCQGRPMTGTDAERIPQTNNQVAVRLAGAQYSRQAGGAACDPDAADYEGNTTVAASPPLRQGNIPGAEVAVTFPAPARAWRADGGWSSAVGGRPYATELCETKGSLVHLGQVPLRIVGALEAKGDVVGLRATAGDTPAVDVFGSSLQGGRGMFHDQASARSWPNEPPSDTRCGISETVDTWGVERTDVYSYNAFSSFMDPDAEADFHNCNSATMQGMGDGGALSPAGDFTNKDVQPLKARARAAQTGEAANPSANPDCNYWSTRVGEGVIRFVGAYDAEDTAIMNDWFDADSGNACGERTFWFGPGDLWFDVNDPRYPEGDPRRNSLVFDNPNSNFVFGSPGGLWESNGSSNAPGASTPASNRSFPSNVCINQVNAPNGSAQQHGASITLSSRTGVLHTRGRVAVCGTRLPGIKYHNTAIWQRPATGLGAQLVPSGVDNAGAWSTGTATTPRNALLRMRDGQTLNATAPLPSWINPNLASLDIDWDKCSAWELWCYAREIGIGLWNWIVDSLGLNPCVFPGICTYERSFRATNFQSEQTAANRQPDLSPGPLNGNAFLDIVVDNDAAGYTSAQTRIELDLSPAPGEGSTRRTCFMEYGPGTPDRLGDNYGLISIDLLENRSNIGGQNKGNCHTQVIDRSQLKGANVTVRFWLNPPPLFSEEAEWVCRLPTIDDIEWQWDWPPIKIEWGRLCNIPSAARISVDSIALRTSWEPSTRNNVTPGNQTQPSLSPVNATCVGLITCVYYDGGAVGAFVANASQRDATYARARGNLSGNFYTATLDYTINDDTLRDGFLPVNALEVNTRMYREGNLEFLAANSSRMELIFTLTRQAEGPGTADGQYETCTVTFDGADLRDRVPTTKAAADATAQAPYRIIGPGAQVAAKNTCLPRLENDSLGFPRRKGIWEMGDIVGFNELSGGPRREARVAVRVYMNVPGGTEVSWYVDHVGIRAEAGAYPRPLAPFRVRWNPRPLSANATSYQDALFTVFGTTSVPNNAVEVDWDPRGWSNELMSGPNGPRATGLGIFNGGALPGENPECNSGINTVACRPGLIAGAVGSWTSGTREEWAAGDGVIDPRDLPDPLATSGAMRKPERQVYLTACVVTENRPEERNDKHYQRVTADVMIRDVDGRVLAPGVTVIPTRWTQYDDERFTTDRERWQGCIRDA